MKEVLYLFPRNHLLVVGKRITSPRNKLLFVTFFQKRG